MKTDTSLVKGRVVLALDLNEIIDSVAPEDRDELMQRIACDETVIEAVVDQVLTGWTANASSGYDDTTFDPAVTRNPNALNAARERLVKGADAVAQLMIGRLRNALRHARERANTDWRKAFDTERGLREQNQALRRDLHDAIESRDHWRGFAERIDAEQTASSKGVAP